MKNWRQKVFRPLLCFFLLVILGSSSILAWSCPISGIFGSRTVSVQILGINDFHGQLNVTRSIDGKPAGRADVLAAYLRQRMRENQNTLLVHAGDAVGGSPPVSALMQDEPTIQIFNELGFDAACSGNHEFDEGVQEMLRLIHGGTHPVTGLFSGTRFPYVCANVIERSTGRTLLPAYTVCRVKGIPIGFIGVVTRETTTIVMPTGIAGYEFVDEAEAINRSVDNLKKQGIKTIVVLAHEPGYQNYDSGKIQGAIAQIATAIDDEVDVIFAGHNHGFLNGHVDGKLIVEAYANGTAFADVDIEIDRRTKDVVAKRAEIVTTWHEGINPDPVVSGMIAKAEQQVAPLINRVFGYAEVELTRKTNPAGESVLGNLVADAHRWAMGTQIAFTNSGGVRADLGQGEVTWGELYAIQPFNNSLVKMIMTGNAIYRLLNEQWEHDRTKMLQISGFSYTWDASRPVGERIISVVLADGRSLDRTANYTVTTNQFLAVGGDEFTVFAEGTDLVTGAVDLDALVEYIQNLSQPFKAKLEGRIRLAGQ